MSEETKKSRKGQVHRTWVKVLIDQIKEKQEKYSAEMNTDEVKNFIDFLEKLDVKLKARPNDNSYRLMVGRFKKMSEDDFKKMMKRQYEAFKESRVKDEPEEDDIDVNELMKDI